MVEEDEGKMYGKRQVTTHYHGQARQWTKFPSRVWPAVQICHPERLRGLQGRKPLGCNVERSPHQRGCPWEASLVLELNATLKKSFSPQG